MLAACLGPGRSRRGRCLKGRNLASGAKGGIEAQFLRIRYRSEVVRKGFAARMRSKDHESPTNSPLPDLAEAAGDLSGCKRGKAFTLAWQDDIT